MKSGTAPEALIWRRSHHLDRMTLVDLLRAGFQHHAIAVYLTTAVLAFTLPIGWRDA